MKKIAIVLLVALAAFAMVGCGATAKETSGSYSSNPANYK